MNKFNLNKQYLQEFKEIEELHFADRKGTFGKSYKVELPFKGGAAITFIPEASRELAYEWLKEIVCGDARLRIDAILGRRCANETCN